MKKSKLNQVGNLEKLVSFANAQGPVYNPSKASIKVAALQTLLTQSQGAIKAADVSRTAYESALNARQEVFSTIPRLGGRLIAVLKANGASPDVVADAMAIKRRFSSQAKKVVDNTPDSTSSPASGTTNGVKYQRKLSQLDWDSKVGNFQRLVIKVTAEPAYQTYEADLQVPALNVCITTLRDKNKAVINAFRAMKEANQAADKLLFEASGIYGQSVAVKAYIQAVYGFGTVKHREVTSLKFIKR